jgi:hypothetical protein
MNGKFNFQIPWSMNKEPLAAAVTNIDVNSVSHQRTYVWPSMVDLTDEDPILTIDKYIIVKVLNAIPTSKNRE